LLISIRNNDVNPPTITGSVAFADYLNSVRFILAGHETSSTGLTWFLYSMTQHQDIQAKLRKELLAFPNDRPSMDELNALPYLDCVLKEVMRVHSPVTSTSRSPLKDEIIPLSEPFLDKNGKECHEIR